MPRPVVPLVSSSIGCKHAEVGGVGMTRGTLIGPVLSIAFVGGAFAADLPVKAKAIEHVRICSAYGAGFYYLPGTDTCMKIGGLVRVDTALNAFVYDQPAWSGDLGQQNRYRDYFTTRSRMSLTVDTRTVTEYGVVRTFGQGDFQFTTFGYTTVNPNSVTTNGSAPLANLLDTPGGGYVAVPVIFLQFAGFTFGKSASAYATPWHGYPGNDTSYLLGGHDSVTGVNNIKYTAEFGSGVTAAIGLDDPTVFNRTSVQNLASAASAVGAGSYAYAGVRAPDMVGNIRIDQAWGLFQISAAAHEVSGSYNNVGVGVPTALSEISGHPDSKWGGSVMAALQIKNIPTGPQDTFRIDTTYAKGDTKNVISTSALSPSFAMFGSTSRPGAYRSVGFGQTTDAVYLAAGLAAGGSGVAGPGGTGDLKLVEAWGIRGAFNHNWNASWSTSLFGSYSVVRYGGASNDVGTGKGQWCAAYGRGKVVSADYRCDPDFDVAQLGIVTRWNPVKNMTISVEVMWFHLDQKFTGAATLTPSAPQPTAVYAFNDQNTVSLNVRVQRNF